MFNVLTIDALLVHWRQSTPSTSHIYVILSYFIFVACLKGL